MAEASNGIAVEDRTPLLVDKEVSELRSKAQVATMLLSGGERS
jgi:hypothetical protein